MGKPVTIYPKDDSSAISTMDLVHHEIHEGHHYFNHYYEKIGAATAINIVIRAPVEGGPYHLVGDIATDGPGIATISKSPNITTGVTIITSFNNNETSSNTTDLVFEAGGTYTSSGTVMQTFILGGSSGTGGNKTVLGSTGGLNNEYIVAGGSVHLIRFVADGASCRSVIRTSFYEQDW